MSLRNGTIALLISLIAFVGCGDDGDPVGTSADATSPAPVEGCTEGEEVTTDSGLTYEELECGTGAEAEVNSSVSVHYTGTLEEGTKFDSSLDRGEPFNFVLGQGMVIAGWDEGIPGMKVGGERKLIIPPELAYGEAGFPPSIPANSTLIFTVQLLEVTS